MFDIEDETLIKLPKSVLTENVIAFCDGLEKAGYYAALYSNPDWLTNRLDYARLKRFDLWLADWRENPSKAFAHGIWQYTDKGAVNGIVGNVDLDIAYKDYPTIIKKAGLNGFGKSESKFEVTAAKSGLGSSAADVLSAKLKDLGMTVVKKEETV
jgi:GH25 family lysozyme M1 (1,4-beta-N-acetylmuramidase)